MPTTILDGETYEQARHRRFTEEAKVIEKMQQDEIIRMAREACAPNQTFNSDEEWVKRFYELAYATGATHEREACAKVCEDLYKHLNYDADCRKMWPHTKMMNDQYAAAIRARGEQ